jgi:hypothetical protein
VQGEFPTVATVSGLWSTMESAGEIPREWNSRGEGVPEVEGGIDAWGSVFPTIATPVQAAVLLQRTTAGLHQCHQEIGLEQWHPVSSEIGG